jgi:fructose-1,6-bisphosphatase/inositol monophosphatase family enzyme
MQHFRTEIDVETKSDATPVTKADRAIERRLREMIASRYPTHVRGGFGNSDSSLSGKAGA